VPEPEVWQPDEESGRAMRALVTRLGVEDSREAHRLSVADPGAFWADAWDDLGIVGGRGERSWLAGGFESRFFPDARLNIADTLLAGDGSQVVLIGVDEGGSTRNLNRQDVRATVGAAAAAMRAHGVVAGDRVAAWAPNVPEVAIFALAALSIGAIVCTTPTDMAPDAVLDRLTQVAPVLLLVSAQHTYGGRQFDDARAAEIISEGVTSATAVVRLDHWDEWVGPHAGAPLVPIPLAFDHPGFILFTSGTTGRPKCIVHSAAGVLLKVLSEQVYHLDIRPGDRITFHTTTGWMMWNWLLMALGARATVVLIDGSPVWPRATRLVDLGAELNLSFLGVSAKYLDLLRGAGTRECAVPTLRTLGSTGSPLAPESFDFVREAFGAHVHVVSMSGGTDICGCFVLGDPTRPLHRGEIQGPALGMDVDVVDESGTAVGVGETGELVCRTTFPSVPLGFWGDEGTLLHDAYFARIPGVWTHGDFITRTQSGGFVIHGRSDATLNAGGIRMGTAEFYAVVNDFPWVADSVVVGVKEGLDEVVALFVVPHLGEELTEERVTEIRSALRQRRSPRHVPAIVEAVPDVPRTRSGKLAELAVADAVNGRPVRDLSGVANPESLGAFAHWARSRSSGSDRPGKAGDSG
jgi:acetoacetyl-CoA synthetase